MQILIEARPVGALRVLPALPNARLAVLEGLNGIGKTLTVRLLQICTGTMPYRLGSPAWASLCRGLGEFRIVVSGLRGASSIEWVADTREWASHADISEIPFRRILIDGKPGSMAHVRRLIVVHRMAGDETLLETLAQQADGAEEVIRRWGRANSDSGGSSISRLELAAAEAVRALGEWSGERHSALVRDIEASTEAMDAAVRTLQHAGEIRQKLEEVRGLFATLEKLRHVAPDLSARVSEVDKQIVQTRNNLDQAQAQIVRVAAHAAQMGPVFRELENAQRTLRRNQEKLTRAVDSAAAAAAFLGLPATRHAVAAETRRLTVHIQELSRRQVGMDSAPAMRNLLDGAATYLAGGESRGLSDQVAFHDPSTNQELSVRELRLGITNRRAELEGQPPPPAAKELAGQLKIAQERWTRLGRLSDLLNSVERYRRLSASNEARVDKALSGVDPTVLGQLQDLERQRRTYDEQLIELAGQRATLRQQLGELSAEPPRVLEARLVALLNEIKVNSDALPEAIEDAQREEQNARAYLSHAQQHLQAVQKDMVRESHDVRRIVASLGASGDLGWLGEVVARIAPMEVNSVEQQLKLLDLLRSKLEGVANRISAHRLQLAGVEAGCRGVARHLRGLDPEAVEYVPELEQWFGRKFSAWFNSGRIRVELLPEADGPVSVDVREREVKWTEQNRDRSRPLEAFSSGEQAFAYTRARLARLDEELVETPNRLIVLDEFGAFIAHDRLAGLLSYLQTRADDHADDQVLVILPLSHDYASEAETSIGRQKDLLQELAAQIAAHRFGVRVLAP